MKRKTAKKTAAKKQTKRAWSPADDKRLKSMVKAGKNGREIAAALKRSVPSIYIRCSAKGISFRRA